MDALWEPKSPYKKVAKKRAKINLSDCRYSVVETVADDMDLRVTRSEDQDKANVIWTDSSITPERLAKLKSW